MDSDEIKEIRDMLAQHEKRISELEHASKSRPKATPKELSVKEFILEKHPQTDIEKTLTIGYFLENHKGFTSFNVDDLTDGFSDAKETVPKNINLAVIGNITKGHMMEAKEKKNNKKAWTLTNTGTKYVENGLKE
jgi:hypothetical protein